MEHQTDSISNALYQSNFFPSGHSYESVLELLANRRVVVAEADYASEPNMLVRYGDVIEAPQNDDIEAFRFRNALSQLLKREVKLEQVANGYAFEIDGPAAVSVRDTELDNLRMAVTGAMLSVRESQVLGASFQATSSAATPSLSFSALARPSTDKPAFSFGAPPQQSTSTPMISFGAPPQQSTSTPQFSFWSTHASGASKAQGTSPSSTQASDTAKFNSNQAISSGRLIENVNLHSDEDEPSTSLESQAPTSSNNGRIVSLADELLRMFSPITRVCKQINLKMAELGIQDKLTFSLPRIVVIGVESAGKSSVIQRLANLHLFPTGETITTRMPIVLALRQKNINRTIVRISTDHGVEDIPLDDTLESRIRTRMNVMVSTANGRVTGVITREFRIELISKDVTDMELIDLPGIVASSTIQGEPANMRKLTEDITRSYIKDPDTMVLMVVPATNSPRTNLISSLIQEYKAEDRTIGILTKSDLVVKVKFRELADKIRGDPRFCLPLQKYGYVALNNGFEPTAAFESITQAETVFFEDIMANLGLSNFNPGAAGLGKLIKRISEAFPDFCITRIKNLKTDIEKMRRVADVRIRALGPKITTSNFDDHKQSTLKTMWQNKNIQAGNWRQFVKWGCVSKSPHVFQDPPSHPVSFLDYSVDLLESIESKEVFWEPYLMDVTKRYLDQITFDQRFPKFKQHVHEKVMSFAKTQSLTALRDSTCVVIEYCIAASSTQIHTVIESKMKLFFYRNIVLKLESYIEREIQFQEHYFFQSERPPLHRILVILDELETKINTAVQEWQL
ncbi:hypothetical protein EDD86DRAFT_219867 [Gorgonomyces haynaldii]|nr:hypothetical protein EDD86DRAFT_219867 [Gorgonomyces haynaldii]